MVAVKESHVVMVQLSIYFKNMYLFSFDCAGSLQLHCAEAILQLRHTDFSCCRAWALGFVGFSSCSIQT